MVPRWRLFGDFLGPAFPASRVHHSSDLHSKFALGPHHVIWTPSNSWFLVPVRAHNPNGIMLGSAVFALVTAECPCTLQWTAHPPQNCPFPWMDLDPNLIRGSLGPPESSTQTASRSVQPFLQGWGLTSVTDRPSDTPTDRPSYSVGNNRPHLLNLLSLLRATRSNSWKLVILKPQNTNLNSCVFLFLCLVLHSWWINVYIIIGDFSRFAMFRFCVLLIKCY